MSTTITPTSGTISSAGIGSGLNVSSIISSLMAVESLPLTALQSKATNLQTDLSAFGQVQSLVSSLQDAAKSLSDPTQYNQSSTSSTDASSVSATTSSGAATGVYSISVSALAAAQSIVSPVGQYTDGTSVVGTGSMTIQLGSWSADKSTFTPGTGAAVTVPIGASSNTLAGIASAINAANAGVSASVVTDASGARLALQSNASGVANGFRVSVADDDGNNTNNAGLSRLAYDPQNSVNQMTLAQAAANTQATINGISVTSSTNSLSGVISGINFNLGKTTGSQPVSINVTANTAPIQSNLQAFVSAFNALNSFMATETKYDPTSDTAAPLQGDSTAVSIQNQMHSLVSRMTSGSQFSTLSSLGVQLQSDGSLSLNSTTFNSTLQNLPALTKALANVDATTPANNGFGKIFSDWAGGLLNSGGILTGKTASIQSSLTSNQKDQDALNSQLAATQARLQAQYTALDSTMSQANALAAYVQQQFYAKSSFGSSSSS